MIQGPNVKRLISQKMAADAVPAGGGLASAIKFLSSKESIVAGARAATKWVEEAIQIVRLAAEPNPWKTANDEEIAAELLRGIAARKRGARRCSLRFKPPKAREWSASAIIVERCAFRADAIAAADAREKRNRGDEDRGAR